MALQPPLHRFHFRDIEFVRSNRQAASYGGLLKIISLNVARPRLTVYKGETISTGIFKQPVAGPVPLRTLNFDGDRQADLSVHGGPYKAVYAYPQEHYPFWRNELPGTDLPWGVFGENLTTEDLRESALHIGDRLQIGAAVVMVRQTRTPCYKLAARFQRDDMVERFLVSGRSGVYFSVEKEGTVAPGDSFEFLSRASDSITIAEMNRLIAFDRYDRGLLEKAIATRALPDDWREHFSERLARMISVHNS
jgi:MOSC domain-containing protein YiiM